jgi:hypothetical protein
MHRGCKNPRARPVGPHRAREDEAPQAPPVDRQTHFSRIPQGNIISAVPGANSLTARRGFADCRGFTDCSTQQSDRVRSLSIEILSLKAEAAATRIRQFFQEIENQIGWTTQLPWSAGTIDQRRFDGSRVLR